MISIRLPYSDVRQSRSECFPPNGPGLPITCYSKEEKRGECRIEQVNNRIIMKQKMTDYEAHCFDFVC